MKSCQVLPNTNRILRYAVAASLLLLISIACLTASPHAVASAYAAEGGLAAGSVEVGTQSSGFKASTTYLDLSPKVKKVPYGHKYIPVHKTVTIKIPDGYYPVTWESSNPKVATAKDSYKAREMKLTVYGNAPGKSTITIWNDATYETVKIRVVVKGYNSKDFKASKTKLKLSTKKKKVSGGYIYTPGKQTITVAIPDQAKNVYWESSDDSIADAKWSGKWNGNTTKLKIQGHRPGKATITLTNSKTKKKVKIKVTVKGGYELGFKWGNPEKKSYTQKNGKKGYYWLNRISLINKTGETVQLDKNCAFRFWSCDINGKAVDVNKPARINGVPVKVKNGKSKVIYVGERESLDTTTTYWTKGILSAKVGKSYKTIYVDAYGMVTKVLDGRKI